ncbi:serine/threonine protein kinase [Streptomyces hygroscopicus]|uniref:protein kinase n=1 Tax=Streptomyces hygroscopicus TaxID=1912 RepID=UPI00223FDD1C|nr:protein kinase [Streptomyces hygroscopicus]MCW7944944.1 serine/threonine protein kinase [Streptomyces hygroscopicus]
MEDYAGRVLADRYRLPLSSADEYELAETRAFDTYSGQEVLVRQVPLPEVVEAEVLDADGLPEGFVARDGRARGSSARATATRRPTDPAVRRAIEAAQAAAQIPDHPRLDQVFDVFAEGGSLWIVSELVAAQPLAALLAEKPLTPYRAAEVASDVLMALRVLHAHGWVHRNITARTVLVCEDGRVVLTGLAAGAAEEALCGYDPVPVGEFENGGDTRDPGGDTAGLRPDGPGRTGAGGSDRGGLAGKGPGGAMTGTFETTGGASRGTDPEAARRAAIQARAKGTVPAGSTPVGGVPALASRALESAEDVRAARAGAIAAYRAGARAAARVQEEQRGARSALPAPRPSDTAAAPPSQAPGQESERHRGTPPPGQIADPYGASRTHSWHGAVPRPAAPVADGHGRTTLPDGTSAPQGDGSRPYGNGGPGVVGGPYGNGASGASGGPYEQAAQATPGAEGAASTAPWNHRGPATALAAERARQARMTVVGPVTERWAPEQAGPVHENWRLAPPIGPATDLWALGALLFRAVQGHAPYPEESTAELVQLVCAEPPAFAEECGPLRPVVESLLRQDPTERLDFEELRGWLRSLVRSAPEPEAGAHVVAAPPVDPRRLPIVRRRGELVRRRRAGLPATTHARHRRAKEDGPHKPRRLGRTLLLLILLALAAAIAYAMAFLPKVQSSDGSGSGTTTERTGAAGDVGPAPQQSASGGSHQPGQGTSNGPPPSAGSPQTQTSDSQVARGFTLRTDPEGFRIAVADGWDRSSKNGQGQIVYSQGDFQLIVAPGRDSAGTYGSDPLTYQRESEPELQPFRDSSWATSSGMRRIDVGGRTMAEGQFTWTDSSGRALFVRNLALLVGGRYHVVQLRGPDAERDEVTRLFEQAEQTYRTTG